MASPGQRRGPYDMQHPHAGGSALRGRSALCARPYGAQGRRNGLCVRGGARARVLLLQGRPGHRGARSGQLLRSHLARLGQRLAARHGAHLGEDGHSRGVLAPREGSLAARDRPALGRCALHGRCGDDLQAGGKGNRHEARGVRLVHAQAHGRCAGQRHARAPEPHRPGRQQRVLRRERSVRLQPIGHGEKLHRRSFEVRSGVHSGHEPVRELLQASAPGRGGSHLHQLGRPQPRDPRAHPGLSSAQRGGLPRGAAQSRPGGQPLSGLRRHARRRPGGYRGGS